MHAGKKIEHEYLQNLCNEWYDSSTITTEREPMNANTQPEALQIIQDMDENWQEDWDGGRIRKELLRLHALNQELLHALKRIMDNDCPLSGNPSHSVIVEYWEYEKSQGRGEAEDRLFALAAIAKATAPTIQHLPAGDTEGGAA